VSGFEEKKESKKKKEKKEKYKRFFLSERAGYQFNIQNRFLEIITYHSLA